MMRNGQPVYDNDGRWIPCHNAGAQEIPPFGLVRCTNAAFATASTGVLFEVDRPNTDSQECYVVNEAGIPVGGYGICTLESPVHVLYDTAGTPANGETWGAASGSYKLTEGKTGFVIEGGASGSVVLARRTGGGATSSTGGGDIHSYYAIGTSPFYAYYPSGITNGYSYYGSNSHVTNKIYAMPLVIPTARTVDRLAAWVVQNITSSKKIRLAIYAATASTNPWPNNLVAETGEISVPTLASPGEWKYEDLGSAASLTPGLYWLAFQSNQSGSQLSMLCNQNTEDIGSVFGANLFGSYTSPFGAGNAIVVSQSYGAFPSTFPSYSSLADLGFGSMPYVFVHYSA